jgi:hypothetical protein
MKESSHERVRAAVADLVGIVIFGLLMATVVEALSPENLLRRDSGTPGAIAGSAAPRDARLSPTA